MRDPGGPEGTSSGGRCELRASGGPGVRDGAYVHATDGSGYRWAYDSLEWHAGAWTGLDHGGHRTRATIDGDRLRVQHGDNPEAVRWFTLDELNMVGGSWRDGNPVVRWCAEIDGRGAR